MFDQEKLKKIKLPPKDEIAALLLDFEEQHRNRKRARDKIFWLRETFEKSFERYLKEEKLLSESTMTEVYYNFSKKEECVRLENHKFKENFTFIHALITRSLRWIEDSYFSSSLFISIDFDTYTIRATFDLKEDMIDIVIIANNKSQLSARDIAWRVYGIKFKDSAKELKGVVDWSKAMIKAYRHDMKNEKKKIRETRKKIRKMNWQTYKKEVRKQWK